MCPKCQQPFKEYKRNYELNEVLSHSKPKKDYAALFKVAVVGTTTVGKSSIIRAFRGVDFTEYLTTTIGNDFAKFDENYKGLLYRIQLWDTAGQ
jgi:GTPase SAR1 family protein